jgi:hypothetical protein
MRKPALEFAPGPGLSALLLAVPLVPLVLLPLHRVAGSPAAAAPGSAELPRAALAAPVAPELPRTILDTTYDEPATVVAVPPDGDLQAALDAAPRNTTLVLASGATYSGNFVLRDKPGTGPIYIRSSDVDSLPAPGQRISPADAPNMAKIVSPNLQPAISTEQGADGWRIALVEVTATHANPDVTHNGLIIFGSDVETDVTRQPTDLTVDRALVRGTPTGGFRRGITINSARTAVIDSEVSNIHEQGADNQAICGWNGPGPFKVVNNRLVGATENLMFGGARAFIDNLVPSDIQIENNYFFKPLSWKVGHPDFAGIPWSIKNLFELKNAQRVLVRGNVFENNWQSGQSGHAVLFTPRGDGANNPWVVVQDVTFTLNIIRNSDSGFNISGTDDLGVSQQTKRISITNNILDGIAVREAREWPFRSYQVLNGVDSLVIDHNSSINIPFDSDGRLAQHIITFGDDPDVDNTNFVYTNNLSDRGANGVFGSGAGEGTSALEAYAPGYDFRRNIIASTEDIADGYPADNFFPPTLFDVGFADIVGGDYRLVPPSQFIGLGLDGKDVGADVVAVKQATARVLVGR